nr:MAG TPA: hypothetical protein [Caudoviricetes sp.]
MFIVDHIRLLDYLMNFYIQRYFPMSDLLLMFLQNRVNNTLLNLYFRAAKLITYFERDDQYDLLDNYLMEIDNIDIYDALSKIYTFHEDILSNIITEYGVFLNETSLAEKVEILEGLLLIEDHEDKESICEIILNGDDYTFTLSELLSFVTMKDSTYYQEYLGSINPMLLSRIYTEASKYILTEETEDDDKEKREIVSYLKSIKEDQDFSRSLVMGYIKNGLSIYLPLSSYLSIFKDELFEKHYTNKDIAINLFLLAKISKKEKDIAAFYQEKLPKYLENLNQISEITSHIRQLSIESRNINPQEAM